MQEKKQIMYEQELKTYYRNLEWLRKENPLGGYVVIRGTEILDVWHHPLDAEKEGLKAWGCCQFLIKNLNDKPMHISSFGSAAPNLVLHED